MAEFSWSDRLAAFTTCLPCLPCLQSSPGAGPIRLPADGDDERSLRGLLAGTDADADADALSMHSTLDSQGRRKKRSAGRARNVLRRQPQRISVMGVALFGRPLHDEPASPEPEDENETDAAPVDDALLARLARGDIAGQRFVRPTAPRGESYLSDATSPRASGFAEEEDDAERVARRARRAERRALKQAALALALDGAGADAGTFEGFPGSGAVRHAIPSPFRGAEADEAPVEEHDEADFDAASYVAPRARSTGGSRDGSSATSGSRAKSKRSKSSRTRSSATASSGAPATPAADAPPAWAQPPVERFPSAGLSGGLRRKSSDAGAFLASR
jgi:hypothetical protein